MKPFVIDARPVRSETISPKEYLKLVEQNPTLIERAQFVPPGPGRAGFGMFLVKYSRHRLRPVHG